MAKYSGIQKEETFKARIFRDFFSSSKYAYEPNIGNIDFVVTEAKTLKDNIWPRHYLWAESKKGTADIPSMFTQLVLIAFLMQMKKSSKNFYHKPHEFKGSGNGEQEYCTKVQSVGNQFRFRTTISDPRSLFPILVVVCGKKT